MGRYQKDLKTLLTLLAAGLDPETGLSMYTTAVDNKRARQDERKTMRRYLVSDMMPTLQEGADWGQSKATLNSLAEAYDVPEGVEKKTKQQILQDFYGGDREGTNVFAQGEDDLGWDESDELVVQKLVEQGASLGYGRAEIRERLGAKFKEKFGDEVYRKYAPNMHQAIDIYFPININDRTPEGGAVPEEDNWMARWDQAAAAPAEEAAASTPAPTTSTYAGRPSGPITPSWQEAMVTPGTQGGVLSRAGFDANVATSGGLSSLATSPSALLESLQVSPLEALEEKFRERGLSHLWDF